MPTGTADRDEPSRRPKAEKRRPRWQRWGLELLFVVVVLVGVRAWQTRDAVSGPAPELAATTVEGEAVRLEGPTLVHFWATWCGVCDAMDGNVAAVAEDHQVITVATRSGGPASVRAHLEEHGLHMPTIDDSSGALARRWGVRSFPTSFFVDADGEIVTTEVGYTSELGLRGRLWWAE